MIFWKRVKQAINDKWYPLTVTVGKSVETQELAQRLARESTISPADAHAVIRALPGVMADFMKESRAVHLEGFGWFRYLIQARGKGVATEAEGAVRPRTDAQHERRLHAFAHRRRWHHLHGVARQVL